MEIGTEIRDIWDFAGKGLASVYELRHAHASCLSLMGTEIGQPRRINKDVAHDLEASGLATRDRSDVCYEDSRRVRREDVDALV
jgi:hypothetical protein